ncbi:MAG: universal stress protein, partial [Chloroflexi bacterium]|nr:universal stress protein [Chloroflexota bacterium]
MATDGGAATEYRHLVVALDGSPVSEQALPHAVALAKAFRAELTLIRIVPSLHSVAELAVTSVEPGEVGAVFEAQEISAEEREADAYLKLVQERVAKEGITVTTRLGLGPEARAIVSLAEKLKADLLVLATHGRGGLARIVLGSVAEAVLRAAPCPVFLVRAADVRETGEVAGPSSGQLLSFEEDARRLGPLAPKPLGVRTIDVNRIVGSVGRARELGLDFRPPVRSQRRVDDQRFNNIVRALERGEVLPPIEAYKLGYNYYVLDGNHRVAAAKLLHQPDIDAVVTEFLPISNEESAIVFAERRHFEAFTGLTRIGASRVGHYPRLEQLIHDYSNDLSNRPAGLTGWCEGDVKEAARHW